MNGQDHWTSGVCPEPSEKGQTVSISVDSHQPLLQLTRALPWTALVAVMTRQWRRAGKNTDGRPGIVNLTAGTLIPEILLDIILPKINGLADRKSRILPIYRGFSH